ncbi:putative reverse transcriptase domain-containing protein [Tanacetum coccineum]
MVWKHEQYMSKTRANYGSGIARPKIDDKDSFELKGQFLKELRDNTFSEIMKTRMNTLRKLLRLPYQGGGYRAAALGFYQRNNANPSYQERRQSMEETLSKFMIESAKRHEENSNMIKEIRASTDAAERGFGSLSSSTEANPRDNVKSILTTAKADSNSICRIRSPQYVELATVKYPKGITKNVLVGIGKFVFLIDFIILDMTEDVKVPLILRRPFLSTAHAKIDVFKRKITLRVGDEKIIFKSVKPASSLIKRVYMLSLRERMELDLEARLMGETLVLNRSLNPLYGDYIELNDLNVPLELRRDQVDDLMPTIEEGEWWKIWMATEIKTWEILFLENHIAKLLMCGKQKEFDRY